MSRNNWTKAAGSPVRFSFWSQHYRPNLYSAAKFWETLGVAKRCLSVFFSTLRVQCWRLSVTGRQVLYSWLEVCVVYVSSELNHNHSPWMLDPDRGVCQARNWGICPSENLKTLLSNFDICRQFQRIKMKFYILIVKIFRNAVCVRFDLVSCLSSEEDNLHRLSQRQQ